MDKVEKVRIESEVNFHKGKFNLRKLELLETEFYFRKARLRKSGTSISQQEFRKDLRKAGHRLSRIQEDGISGSYGVQ